MSDAVSVLPKTPVFAAGATQWDNITHSLSSIAGALFAVIRALRFTHVTNQPILISLLFILGFSKEGSFLGLR